ncbi:MAG: GNAT family N-acetyltransferase [Chloroflexi bacterium]|nr:GNAT family N-acetyltransferase [Chloroflexota bacterium]
MDGALVGYATILPNIAPQVYFLEYLAIAREQRNAGIGGRLLRHLARELRGKASGLIWEVETPDVGTPDERQLRARRIAFYARNGGLLIECAPRFLTPNLAGGEPLAEKLMWLPLAENSKPPRGEALRECIVGILTRDYGLAENDALVQENLRALKC